jgi:hypothetical protein
MEVGLSMPALDRRTRNATSAAIVNTGRSILLFLRCVVLVYEQGYDGRYEDYEGKRTRE